ncbi:MAG: YggT family protein [Clostridia bacterium]|nr:YggT family protein [Clostridia bacterium]MBQ6933876.1 YggT family protein [Clostridia bacterium]
MLRTINLLALNTASSMLAVFEYLLMFRAIMSWFPQMQGSRIYEFIYGITEPVVMPFRKLIQNVDALRGFPIDISFMLAFMTIIFLEILLQGMI